MANKSLGERIDDLIQLEKWNEARALIRPALKQKPDSHWLLTQLAETYYEERHYAKALKLLVKSKEIVPECPLTNWHVAGALDALGRHEEALNLFLWLLSSKKSSADDPCWESPEWTAALKTDCVYSIGLCYRHLNRAAKAIPCFNEYIRLLSLGMAGSYSMDDAARQLAALQLNTADSREAELQRAAKSIRRDAGRTLADVANSDSTRTFQTQ